jgi:hypothetical protein
MFFHRARLVSLEAHVGRPHGRWATELYRIRSDTAIPLHALVLFGERFWKVRELGTMLCDCSTI